MQAKLRGTPAASDFTELGIWFAQHEQYACAANAFATSLQADPQQRDYAHVAFMFGSALYFSEDATEGIPAMQEAERLGYRDEKVHAVLAAALDSTGARADAEAEWRQALALNPESTSELDALAEDLAEDGNAKAVIETLDQPRLAAQRSAELALKLASAYAKTGQVERAAAVLQDAFNTWPRSVDVATALAKALEQLGRKDEAATVVQLIRIRKASPSGP